MAAIDPIYNGEGGASVRAKLNQLIDTVNSGSQTINVGDAPIFDPNKAGGYEAGSIISYKNESSPDPEFHEFAIYLALYDIPQGVSPEDSPNWKNEGATVEVAGGNTANGVVQSIDRLRELTGMRTGHSVTVEEGGHVYVFNEGSEAGIKPFAPGIGSWELKYTKSVVEWQPGTYRSSPTLVLRNNAIYRLTRPVPFESTDFEAEASDPIPVWTKVSGGGGHTFEDQSGTALPTRSVAKAGAGIEFEDDAVNEMTVVRVSDEVTMKAANFNQGNLKKFDANGNDEDSGLTGESLDIYDIGAAVVNELTTESNWIDGNGDPITTPIVLSGGLKGQRYYSNDYFYECVSDFNWCRTFTGRPVIDIYNNPNLTLTDKSNLENAANWSAKVYIGPAIEGVAAGTRYYDNDYVYEFVQTNLPIRYART